MGARWISYLRKRELEAILKEFSLQATGTVKEIRSRLAAFNNRDDHVLEIAERLQECEAEITAALTDRKQCSPTPNPHPPGPTQPVSYMSQCQSPLCWDCGRRGVRTLECFRRTQPGNERSFRPLGERTEIVYRNPRN
ncbi:uncharacterized protein LOC127010779 [Drosophila biarmipes]|uniref:uncharacterized protein LOC127010779 n=1 Tax=Drosophila biarmipes TaxID=125945 RepID=UPI0021CD0024|nr:uncharacterized protein LOC127010779 [Drosophila biarmipes]XP_050741638.1 uncharacterized protein LOC127010779 [Drosophila biarmipes]XP_050741639.1 uncharacterized protein LOC127010779 [Drosophila biarmipes]XP_050741640.1 uncharacterized protein LOC127010779 [Drosophila biarmipes]XP_050741641.1 uncharacterized protein LOC127010779 [Drosophila biarmipes]